MISTSTAVEAICRRLALRGLRAHVLQCDAENLPFTTGAFDFVWSWGVIHHSSRTARIVREIARVLNRTGACRVMVYNREGMPARICFIREYVLRGGFLGKSILQGCFIGSLWPKIRCDSFAVPAPSLGPCHCSGKVLIQGTGENVAPSFS